MAITPMDKTKVMRPSLIDAVDKINEIITAVNTLDPTAINSRVAALETWQTSTDSRLATMASDISTNTTNIGTNTTDITTIKTTLYTPLSSGGN